MPSPADTSVMIFAAGRGQRMMPLTKDTPKPLLKIGKLSLIEHQIKRLRFYGFKQLVINVSYLGDKIIETLGNGSDRDVSIDYSDERISGALETAGGIINALDKIKSEHFLCVNADIWSDINFEKFFEFHTNNDSPASIILAPNPDHNLNGDFAFDNTSNKVCNIDEKSGQQTWTFTGIGIYSKQLFSSIKQGKQPLAPLLKQLSRENKLSGLIHRGQWQDIGTPERLENINQRF